MKRNITHLALLALMMVLTGGRSWGQVSTYTFGSNTGTYSPITGGTLIPSSVAGTVLDDDATGALPIGFTFVYNGVSYTQFGYNANGWISMGSATPVSTSTAISSGTTNNIIAALNNDLIGRGTLLVNRTSGSPTLTVTGGDINLINVGDAITTASGIPTGTTVLSKTATTITMSANATTNGTGAQGRYTGPGYGVRYQTIGSSPNRTLVVQWTGFTRYNTSSTFGELYNFQIRLNETTNTIDIVYNIQGPNSTTANTYQVGLRGAAATDYNNRTNTTSWTTTTAGGSNAATMTLSSTVTPPSGLTYTWTPPSCSAPTLSAATSVAPTSATLNWTAPGTAPSSGYQYEVRTSGAAGSGPTGLTASGSTAAGVVTANVIGLTPSTAYSAYVRSNCGSGTFSAWAGPQTFTTPPANDDCAGAISVTPGATCVTTTGTTVNATASTAPAATTCTATGASNDVFYTFTANGTDGYDINVTPATGRYSVILYAGACASLTQVNCVEGAAATSTTLNAGILPAGTYTYRLYARNGATGTFTTCVTVAQPVTVGTITATQQTGDVTAGTTNNNILRVEIPATGTLGTQTISSVTVNYTGTSAADIDAAGVTLWTGTASAPTTQIGTAQSFSGGTATFSGLTTTLALNATTYLWVRLNTAATATVGNNVDVSIPAGGIVINNTGGAAAAGTQPPAALNPTGNRVINYCTPSTTGSATYFITNFTTTGASSNISNASATSPTPATYTNFSASVTGSAQLTSVVNFSVSIAGGSTYGLGIWIDFNADGDFADAGEIVYSTNATTNYLSSPITGSFTIPGTATLGTTRLRVGAFFSVQNPGTSAVYCGTTTSTGEYEDYGFTILPAPACQTPTTVAASATSATTASVTFTSPGSSFIAEYGATGFTPGTGATAGTGGTIVTGTASPITISGLSGNTTYQVYVRQVCAGPSYSGNSAAVSFTTPCAAISSFPSTEAFATYLPTCWYEGTGGSPATGPTTVGGASLNSWVADGFANNGTTGAARYNLYLTGDNAWLISPNYAIPATGAYEVTFQSAATDYDVTTAVPAAEWTADDFIEVLISNNDGASWTVLETYNNTNQPSNTGTTEIYPLNAYNGQTVKFAFRVVEGATTGQDFDFSVDNFTVQLAPACPAVTAVSATATSPTSASVSFTSPGTSFIVEYGPTGLIPGTGATAGTGSMVVTGTASPIVLTGLTSSTAYQVYVRQACSGPIYSANSTVVSFTTPVANDDCAGAINITPGATCVATAGTTVNATPSTAPAATTCTSTGVSNDVFYTFTATGTDGYNINVTPANGRYSIILYSGACGSLTQVGCIEATAAAAAATLNTGILPAGTYTYRLYARNNIVGTFTTCVAIAQPLTVGTITATQQTGDVTPGSTNNNILRVEIPTTGTLGTQTIGSVTVNYTGTTAADIAASGVTLWTGTATAPSTQIGTAQSFSGGTATFSGLTTAITTATTTYLWVRLNTAGTATLGNNIDVSIPAGGIVINATGGATPAGTQPATALNPAGNRVVGYCTPSTASGSATYYITNFTTTGAVTNINNTSATSPTPASYTNFSGTVTGSAYAGSTVSFSTTIAPGGTSDFGLGIWADLNGDGDFADAGETLYSTTAYTVSPITGSFTIPATANVATTRLRIAALFNVPNPGTSASYCGATGAGEYEDYSLNILPQLCTGTPTAGTVAISGQTTYCVSAPAKTLTLSGYTTGVSGISIQWQSSPDGAAWANISGATGATYTTPVATVTEYYRAVVTCSNGGGNAASNAAIITVNTTATITTQPAASQAVCQGAALNLSVSASNAAGYQWYLGGNPISGANSPTYTVASTTQADAGTYTVEVSSNAPCGSVTSNSAVVNIDNPSVSLTPANSSTTCGGSAVAINITTTNASNPVFTWNTTQDLYTDAAATMPYSGGAASVVYAKPSSDQQYRVTVTSNGCTGNGAPAVANVEVNGMPTATANNSGAGNTEMFSPVGSVIVRNNDCELMFSLVPSGGNPVSGMVNSSLTLGNAMLTANQEPYVGRVTMITPVTGASTATGTVTLYVTAAEFAAYNAILPGASNQGWTTAPTTNPSDPNAANVRVTKFPGTGGYSPSGGVQLTPTSIVYNSTLGAWAITVDVTGFSSFYVHTANATNTPLPVTLVSLTAENAGDRNRIEWQSAVEHNVASYVVERSANGTDFTRMDEVPAQGKAFGYITYDNQPNAGLTYYRLKMMDQDGTAAYSKVVSAFMSRGGEVVMSAAPNPMRDVLTVTVYGAQGGDVQLTDLSGRVVSTTSMTNGQATINTQSLAPGVYFVKWTNGSVVKTIKVTKQ